jgi:hypothetical protein
VSSAAVGLVRVLQPHLDRMGVRVLLRPFHVDHLVEVTAAALERFS